MHDHSLFKVSCVDRVRLLILVKRLERLVVQPSYGHLDKYWWKDDLPFLDMYINDKHECAHYPITEP